MIRKAAHHHGRFARALALGSFVLSVFCILLGLILFVTGPLQENQELRRNAMVPTGDAQLVFSPEPGSSFPQNATNSFDISVVPYTVIPSKVEFVFDIITHETIEVSDVQFHQASGIRKDSLEFKRVDHGYHVTFAGQFPDGGAHGGGSTPLKILTVEFHPKKNGTFVVNFDKEKSRLLTATASGQLDELRTMENFVYTVTAPPSESTSDLDDLYFQTLDSTNTKFTFYALTTNTEIDPARLESGKQYNVVHVSRIQNNKKSQNASGKPVIVQLKINDSINIRNSITLSQLASKSDGDNVKLEGIFTAGTKNNFKIAIDPDNVFTEQSEANNTWEITYETAGTGGSSAQCNQVCSSNSDCGSNQRCYNTGNEKRCRLATNVTNTACANAPDQGLSRSCNQYCADTRECAAGLTCWNNQCRLLQNLESRSCTLPRIAMGATTATTKGGLTTSTPITYQACNESCLSNRDCTAGLRCYQGACRHPLNPTSTACSATTGGTNAGGTPAPTATPTSAASPKPAASATPAASVSPTASVRPTSTPATSPRPTVTPTPTPILNTSPLPTTSPTPLVTATPTLTPEPTTGSTNPLTAVLAAITAGLAALSSFFANFVQAGALPATVVGLPIAYLVIGIGALFLLIAILLLLFSRRKPAEPAPAKPDVNLQKPQHNPPPPKEVLARRTAPDVSLIRAAAPVVPTQAKPDTQSRPATPPAAPITRPPVEPVAPKQAYTPAIQSQPVAQKPLINPPTSLPPAAPTPATVTKPSPTVPTPQPATPPVAPPPAIIEKPPLPAPITHELPAIPEKLQLQPLQPSATTTQPTPEPLASPEELLKQAAAPKVSMADRLKMKGVEFTKDSSQG